MSRVSQYTCFHFFPFLSNVKFRFNLLTSVESFVFSISSLNSQSSTYPLFTVVLLSSESPQSVTCTRSRFWVVVEGAGSASMFQVNKLPFRLSKPINLPLGVGNVHLIENPVVCHSSPFRPWRSPGYPLGVGMVGGGW